MSIGASAMLERTSLALLYLDVILIVVMAAPVLALGAPVLGYAVGGAAWIVGRAGSAVAEKRIKAMDDIRRQIGFGVASSMGRVWVMAGTIVALGLLASRADALTAALVIFSAFSIYFIRSAVGQMTQRRSPNR
jgi:hypothetical protein